MDIIFVGFAVLVLTAIFARWQGERTGESASFLWYVLCIATVPIGCIAYALLKQWLLSS